MTETTLNLRVSARSAFLSAIARHAREQARLTRESSDTLAAYRERRCQALEAVSRLVESLDVDDQRAKALQTIQTSLSRGKLAEFNPTPTQHKLFHHLGVQTEAPTAEETLLELVSAGASDLPRVLGEADERVRVAESQVRKLGPFRDREPQLKAERDRYRDERDEARSEAQAAREQRDYLSAQVAALGGNGTPPTGRGKAAKPKTESERPPRRVKVEGVEGVYRRPGSDRLEITYTDGNARQRWSTLDTTDVDEAVAERASRVEQADTLRTLRTARV
jgi:hypothetical protein